MRVRDWMARHVVAITPETSVFDARRILRGHGVRHLPVVEGRQVVGMLSDRDLPAGEASSFQALSALQSDLLSGRYRRVGTVMSAPVQSVAPDERVDRAARHMLASGVGALPVIDRRGRLVGIISISDCLRALLEQSTAAGDPLAGGDPDGSKPVPPPGDEGEGGTFDGGVVSTTREGMHP